jgi:PAS domain S-box-containing protein
MYISPGAVEAMIAPVVLRAASGEELLYSALEALPAPIYVTDPSGFVVYFNKACIKFSGRRPAVGKDRWCVTWKLYSERGDYLPHEQCPMAQAIRTAAPIRGMIAIAARPDGTRVTFRPFPTPLFGPDGTLIGAINILIDVNDIRQSDELEAEAARCDLLAATVVDGHISGVLSDLGDEYRAKAADLRRGDAAALPAS